MKIAELRNQEQKELDALLADKRKSLFNLRFQSASEQIEDPSRIGHLRRDIAQILTVLRERKLGIRGQSASS
jgi:large subunit ribosomal protein L29